MRLRTLGLSLVIALGGLLATACTPCPQCPTCPATPATTAAVPTTGGSTAPASATASAAANWWCYRFAWIDNGQPGSNSECVRAESKCRSDIEITRADAPQFAIEECAPRATSFCYSFRRFDGSTGDLCFIERGHCEKSITLGIGSNPTPCTERR